MESHTVICKGKEMRPLTKFSVCESVNQRGYTLAGALTLIAVMSILMALAVESWSWVKRRDNELELIFRGKEYAEAIGRYQQKYGAYPPDLDTLYKLKFIRRLYKDPMTESGKWKVLHPDSLVQLGLAGQTTPTTATSDQKSKKKTKSRQSTGPRDEQQGMGDQSSQDQNSQDQKEDDNLLSGDEDKDEEEEPEVESTGPVVGVVSRSKKASIKVYNNQSTYNKWYFAFALQQVQQIPQPGVTPPPKTPRNPNTPPPPPPPPDDNNE